MHMRGTAHTLAVARACPYACLCSKQKHTLMRASATCYPQVPARPSVFEVQAAGNDRSGHQITKLCACTAGVHDDTTWLCRMMASWLAGWDAHLGDSWEGEGVSTTGSWSNTTTSSQLRGRTHQGCKAAKVDRQTPAAHAITARGGRATRCSGRCLAATPRAADRSSSSSRGPGGGVTIPCGRATSSHAHDSGGGVSASCLWRCGGAAAKAKGLGRLTDA